MVGKALSAMLEYFGTDHMRVKHSLSVYGYVCAIALREGLKKERMPALECAAVLHDIGVPESLRVFTVSSGKYRELMGVKVAGELLGALQFPTELSEEILFLIGHHQSFHIDGGLSLQILFEADALATLLDGNHPDTPEILRDRLFRTRTGRELLDAAFGIQPPLPQRGAGLPGKGKRMGIGTSRR